MASASIPVLTQFENRSSSLTKDAKLMNGYGDMDNPQKTFAVKRPGVTQDTVYVVAAAQGVHNYLNVLRVVVNNRFYKTATTYVAIDAGGLRVDFV